MSPQDLGQRELTLLQLYCGCQLGMTPQAFYARWGVTHAQIAQICGVSEPTVARWFSQGKARRSAEAKHRRKLAEMHFLWEEYERIPLRLRQQLCRTPNGKVLSP
jgi:hypothetical protein